MTPSRRTHGIFSIILFFIAVGMADGVVFSRNAVAGWVYLGVIVAGTLGVVYSFCAKCCCKHRCSHMVLGMLARLLPKRKVGKYTGRDVTGMAASFLSIVLFPQVWLWSAPILAIAFWILAVVIVFEIARKVCPTCQNTLCPFHPRAKVAL